MTTIILKTPVSKLSFDYLSTFVFLIFLLVSLYNNSIFTCNEKTKCYLAYIIMVVTFIYIFIYILFKNSEKIYWNGNKYYLTFNLTNPNLTGFFLLFLFIYNLMCSFSVGRFLKLISLIFSLSLVFLILQTQARSCLIALLFLVFAVLLFRKYPLNNFIMLLCILIPLIFVMLYMFIIEKGSDLTFLNIFVDEGKGLDSRYEIWKRTLDIIKSNLIGGNYYQISDGTGRFQMHNIWLHVCSGFGVIICIRFYFRPLTPTQYYNEGYKHPALRYVSDKNANVPVPIFFLFNLEKLLMDPNIKFSEMSQAGNGAPMLCGEKSFTELSFEKIYSDGFVDEDILKYRHAELLYPNSYEINNSLEVILCRNEFEQSMLLSLLRRENEKLFYKYKPMIKVCREKLFEKNGLFIHDIHLDGNKISFVFVNNYEKQQYTKVMMQKNLVNEIEPVKMLISFEWKTAKQTLKKESVNLNIDYLKTSGIAFTVPAVEKATILNTEVFCFGDLIGYKEFILTNII